LTDAAWSNPTGQTPNMSQWALPGIAVMLIAYGAVSGRLRSTPVSQAMVFLALGLLVGGRVLDLVEADAANQFVRHPAEAASYGHRGLRSSGAKRGPTTAARGIKRGQLRPQLVSATGAYAPHRSSAGAQPR
jgi:hypothetical protein